MSRTTTTKLRTLLDMDDRPTSPNEIVDTTTWEYQLGLLIVSLAIGAWVDRLPIEKVRETLPRLWRNSQTSTTTARGN